MIMIETWLCTVVQIDEAAHVPVSCGPVFIETGILINNVSTKLGVPSIKYYLLARNYGRYYKYMYCKH